MARLSREEVAKVARLARIALDDAELERFTDQLAQVLEHAADLEALDLAGVAPTAHPHGLVNVVREDEVRVSLERTEVLAQAPDVAEDRFSVPRIIGEAP
ncbi:MAG TPA: Asp-tRNA(Asn)/Glu-tRNA(Gln) amidotransferase subunit GatC [Acidimicrobiales bacterium]|nr:MAG: aspartyl/glutamyl-tRNA(Asn/Gln) amidotransferase subunit C [Actinobacteria bacterium 21-73-9]HQU25846.1 Asp-tRNA(Asn)/Glu-tRNA(Gln) amidotransferase subunit GatC [Acidimicrobiales bacterium]